MQDQDVCQCACVPSSATSRVLEGREELGEDWAKQEQDAGAVAGRGKKSREMDDDNLQVVDFVLMNECLIKKIWD
jgi:hypothetical protein